MGKTVVLEIRNNYTLYSDLLKNRKSIIESVIEIKEVKLNKKNFLLNQTSVKHITLTNEIVLIAEVKLDNYKYFQFKLRCENLSKFPFFRFDSDGASHRNYDEDLPLSEQRVETPHFHHFNTKGVNIAYKTTKLLDKKESKALEDISLCIAHFCNEANIHLNNDEFPTVSIVTGGLPFSITKDDPNKGVIFS